MNRSKLLKNDQGEGAIQMILLAALLIGGGYYALQYFGFLGDKPAPAASAPSTLNGGQAIAGSPAAAAVQGAEAAGDLLSSGR